MFMFKGEGGSGPPPSRSAHGGCDEFLKNYMSHTIINVMHVAKITINTSTCIHFQGGIVMLCTAVVHDL